MIRGRTGEHWARSFHAAPWVSYAEALCWIYYRDTATIGALGFVSSDRDYAEMGSGTVAGLLALEAGLGEWGEAAPELALLDALEAGTITASAAPFGYVAHVNGGGHHMKFARRDLQPVEWLDVYLVDALHPFDKAATAMPKDVPAGAVVGRGFTDIWFSRPDLTHVFPGAGSVVPYPARPANENAKAPSIIEFSERATTLAAAVAAVEAEGLTPSKGNLAVQCARLYRKEWGQGRSRAETVEGMGEAIERQWAAKHRQRSLDWLKERASRG